MTTILTAIDIAADATTVYEAIATEKGQRSFWTSDCDVAEVEGGALRFGFEKAPADLELEVAKLEPSERVLWTGVTTWPHWAGTSIAWELQPSDWVEGGTTVLLRHDGWAAGTEDRELGRVTETWSGVLGKLKSYVETGEADPYFA